MSKGRLQGFVFVHGINQSQDDLRKMDRRITELLQRHDLIQRFQHKTKTYVWTAKWRSLGNFLGDLEDLYRHRVRCDEAVIDVQHTIKEAWALLAEDAKTAGLEPSLLVWGHSMGQPISLAALYGLQPFPMPTSLLTIGGPAANCDPVVDKYLRAGMDGEPWVKSFCPEKPKALKEWIDVFNPLDPVCHAPIFGSKEYPGSQHVVFKVPGQLPVALPFENTIVKYHSAYFDYPEIYQIATEMLDRL